MNLPRTGCFGAVVFSLMAAGVPGQPACEWTPGFSGANGVFGSVRALTRFDDGSGAVMVAGGSFDFAGGVAARNVAVWNGLAWSPLGAGLDAAIAALAVLDAGNGPRLYAAGAFSSSGAQPVFGVARWNGQVWEPTGSLNAPINVWALATFDDGTGPALFAGANATPGPFAGGVARFDGTTWTSASSSLAGAGIPRVQSLAVFDDGAGSSLFAGGTFDAIGGVLASRIARWNGTNWSPVGGGLVGSTVYAMKGHDDGSGPRLFVTGAFTVQGGGAVSGLAAWDGLAWQPIGAGLGNAAGKSLGVFDAGSGPDIYVGKAFGDIARWDGSILSDIGAGSGLTVDAFETYDAGAGRSLFAGGTFTAIGGVQARGLAHLDATGWTAVTPGLDNPVLALEVLDLGAGPRLFAGGVFTTIQGVTARGLATFDGTAWSPVGGGVSAAAFAFARFDDGTGPALYVGGSFSSAGSTPAANIARWDGISWSPLGPGVTGTVEALAVYDDGTGTALYAGGSITQAGSIPVSRLARWNGVAWSSVRTLPFGLEGVSVLQPPGCGNVFNPCPVASVSSLQVFDDGGGPALYIGGRFTHAGGIIANSIARWGPAGYSTPFPGMDVDRSVLDLAVHDDGSGPALYAGGSFSAYGANNIARWNGQIWDSLGGGVTLTSSPGAVFSLESFDDGLGPALFVGGSFDSAGGVPVSMIARWRQGAWGPLGAGLGHPWRDPSLFTVASLAGWPGATGSRALFAGGTFITAGLGDSLFLGRWRCGADLTLSVTQPGGPGAPILISNGGLVPGHEYYNLFSFTPCSGTPGTGPLLGLCPGDPTNLLAQLFLPVGTIPFHFIASGSSVTFGPYTVPPAVADGVAFDGTGNVLGSVSPVIWITVL